MRQVYRIDLTNSYYLRGVLRAKGSDEVEGKLVDISSRGAALVFHSSVDPRLVVGDEVELAFCVPGSSAELRTTANVRVVAKPEDFVRYGFEFGDFKNFDGKIPPILRAVFNRRRAPRVTPEATVVVGIATVNTSIEGKLVDLSVCGLSVEIPFHAAGGFDCGTGVELSFTFPARQQAVRIAGTVRDRRLVGPTIHLGIEYDAQTTVNLADNMGLIEDYVASREMSPDYIPS